MWLSRNKNDLIIEVWEKLDCESVGSVEILAIETAVRDQFGASALDSPMILARLLADEGAELRHSEILALYVERANEPGFSPSALRNDEPIDTFRKAEKALSELENLRRKYNSDGDKQGLRAVRDNAIAKKEAAQAAANPKTAEPLRQLFAEIAQWFTVWLQTPELFETWVALRKRAPEFVETFGDDSE